MDFWLAGQLWMKQMQMCVSVAFFTTSESKHMHRTRAPLDPLCFRGCGSECQQVHAFLCSRISAPACTWLRVLCVRMCVCVYIQGSVRSLCMLLLLDQKREKGRR